MGRTADPAFRGVAAGELSNSSRGETIREQEARKGDENSPQTGNQPGRQSLNEHQLHILGDQKGFGATVCLNHFLGKGRWDSLPDHPHFLSLHERKSRPDALDTEAA